MAELAVTDSTCVFYFLLTIQDVFASIRANPQADYNVDLLSFFDKYIDRLPDLTAKDMAVLKRELGEIESIDANVKDSLIVELNNITW